MKQYISDVLFPVFCLGCNTEGEWVCQRCAELIPILTQTQCMSCDVNVVSSACCASCSADRAAGQFWSLYSHHESIIERLIETLKYSGASDIGRAIERLCVNHPVLQQYKNNVDLIAVVPLHTLRFRERGFNQSDCIARAFAPVMQVPIISTLKRTRATQQQARLSQNERVENVKEAFVCTQPTEVVGKRVLLVDDVLTTGSTTDACARALQDAGAVSVSVLTLARG